MKFSRGFWLGLLVTAFALPADLKTERVTTTPIPFASEDKIGEETEPDTIRLDVCQTGCARAVSDSDSCRQICQAARFTVGSKPCLDLLEWCWAGERDEISLLEQQTRN